jgi:hypothetical protein
MKENLEDFDEELERQEDLRLKEADQKRMAEWASLIKSNNPHPDDEEDENNLHSPFPSSSSSSFGAKVSIKAKKWGRSCRASTGYYLRLMAKCIRNPNIASCTFGGMINNIKDGVAWGVIPLFFRNDWQVSEDTVAILLLIYPLTWGILELFSGALSDRYGRKWFMASGLAVQSFALGLMVATPSIFSANAARVTFWMLSCFLLGLGTALGYPVFQAAISDEPPAEL